MIIGTTLIVLTWAVFVGLGLPVWLGVIITVLSSFIILLGLLFVVYFFNLDMKLLAAIQGPMSKIYDKRKRDKRI